MSAVSYLHPCDAQGVPSATHLQSLFAIVVMLFLALVCRWIFSPPKHPVRRPVASDDYGLLRPVTTAPTAADAQMLRDLLVAQGLRASVGARHEVLVFDRDLEHARALLSHQD